MLLTLSMRAAAASGEIERCEAELAAHPYDEKTATCFLEEGSGRPGEAAAHLRAVLLREPDLPWFSLKLGHLDRSSSLEAAEHDYRMAGAGFASRRDLRGQLIARENLWDVLNQKGQHDEAQLELARAIQAARGATEPLLVARGQILTAKWLVQSGHEIGRAYALLQAAEKILASDSSAPDQHGILDNCLNNLGSVAAELGLFDEARRYYTRRLELAKNYKNAVSEAAAQYGIARTSIEPFAEAPSEEGRAKALAATRDALRLATGVDPATEAEANLMLAGLERGTAPRKHLEACRNETEEHSTFRSYCLNQRARYFAMTGDLDEAQAAVQALAEDNEDPWAEARAKGSAMRVAWARSGPAGMVSAGEDALHAIEALRSGQEASESQAGLFSTWSDDFYWFSGKLLDAADAGKHPRLLASLLDPAFNAMERLRARTLLDTLVKAQVEPPSKEELVAREKALDEAIERVEARASSPSLPEIERRHAREDEGALKKERSQVSEQLAHPRTRPQPSYATLNSIRHHLGPREALLSFQVAPWTDWTGDFGGGTWLTVVTRDAPPRAYKLCAMGRPDLRREVEDFLATLSPAGGARRPQSHRERELATDLYAKLLASALAALPETVDRLIVVPDDELHRLPFAALQASPEGPPLARRYDLSLAPSATLWLRWREGGKAAPGDALALANPPLPNAVARQRLAESGFNLPDQPLPYAEREADSAVSYLGAKKRTGADVSKPYLLDADLKPFGLLLFATHALVNERDPADSGIWLSPGRDPRAGGLLRMPEIARLHLDGKAVVLSACSTADGKLIRGEGVLSLARAFFEAKASAVVASLWPQWDDDSAALFERFYYHLAEGKSLAAALAEAQRDRMDAGAPASSWAGFEVFGDGDRVPLPGGRGWLFLHRRPLALAGAAAAAALALLAAAWARRRAAMAPTAP